MCTSDYGTCKYVYGIIPKGRRGWVKWIIFARFVCFFSCCYLVIFLVSRLLIIWRERMDGWGFIGRNRRDMEGWVQELLRS